MTLGHARNICESTQIAPNTVSTAGRIGEGSHVTAHTNGLTEGILVRSCWAGLAQVCFALVIQDRLGEVAGTAG